MASNWSIWTGAIATRSEPWRASLVAGALLALVSIAGCADDPGGELVVSAAASLTGVFTVIEDGFEAEHPGVDVILNLGATSTLARQIIEGAPVDVFAAADVPNMDRVGRAGLVAGEPLVFATNRLEIAVARGNPTGAASLADLADDDRVVGLCAPTVPCGRLAREALQAAGVVPSLDSEEPNVRALLTKIATGEIDMGIVYRTDIAAEPRVEGIPIPDRVNVVNEYVIATLSGAEHPGVARDFVEYVLSPAGRDVLEAAGFGPP